MSSATEKEGMIVLEEILGLPLSFRYDGNKVITMADTAPLTKYDTYYNYKKLYNRHKDRVVHIFNLLKNSTTPSIKQINLIGVVFGGYYPHKHVKSVEGAIPVQKEIYYHPDNEFMPKDLYVMSKEKKGFISYTDMLDLCKTVGLIYLEPLYMGTLKKALEYSTTFESIIHKYYQLPAIENNKAYCTLLRSNDRSLW